MSALVAAGRLGDAVEVLDWMRDDGVAGNAVVYQVLINAFLERGQQEQVGAGWQAAGGLGGRLPRGFGCLPEQVLVGWLG